MTLKRAFIVICFITSISTFDVVRDLLNRMDQETDPCDDFYRHYCPASIPGFFVKNKYDSLFKELREKQKGSVWENLEIEKALDEVNLGESHEFVSDYILQSYRELCDEESHLQSEFLLKVQQMILGTRSNVCGGQFCLLPLAGDSNCTRSVEILFKQVEHFNTTASSISNLKSGIVDYLEAVRSVGVILDGDYRNGIEELNNIIEEEVEELLKMIQVTPWVNNQGIKESLDELTRKLKIDDNFGLELRTSLDLLMKLEQNFLKCSADLEGSFDLLCLMHTSVIPIESVDMPMDSVYNAENNHPTLTFGTYLYAAAQDVQEDAAKLGFVGHVVGHEISHTLIENPNEQELLPYSSKEAIDCIQNQYNNTCTEFVEDSCEVNDSQIDENGSDILGLQLAYKIFENRYPNNKNEIYLYLNNRNVTYQQLFFYGAATFFCNGSPSFQHPGAVHSARNIRVNAYVAQHPAFQEAFQCSPDSRMMRTVEKQCIIYGEGAPENKRKKFQRRF